MRRVFADTFYFLALVSQGDAAHSKALEASRRIEKLVTSEWVLTELADGLAMSRRRDIFLKMRDELLADADAQVVPLDMELHRKGVALYSRRRYKTWSLTDCVSFVIMENEGVREALTGDHHFEQAGFIALLK